MYPERVVEGLRSSLTEVELVGKLTLLGLLRSHQFFFNHFFRCLAAGERERRTGSGLSHEKKVAGNWEWGEVISWNRMVVGQGDDFRGTGTCSL